MATAAVKNIFGGKARGRCPSGNEMDLRSNFEMI